MGQFLWLGFPCFFLGCKAGITSQDGARPALFQNCCVVLCIVCFVSFYVLFVCKSVLYFCRRVTTKLQLTKISYHIKIILTVTLLVWCFKAKEQVNDI